MISLKHARIGTLGTAFSGLLVIVTAVVLISSFITYKNAEKLGSTWSEFESGPAAKTAILGEIRDAIGYGGAIHQFKNFILRQDRPRIVKIQAAIMKVVTSTIAYNAIPGTQAERDAIATIQGTFLEYRAAIGAAERLAADGATAREIDRAVKISDGPAIAAIATLETELLIARQSSAATVDEAVTATERTVMLSGALVSSLLLLVIVGFIWLNRFKIVRSLTELGQTMVELSNGDNTVTVAGLDRRDEIGSMAQAVEVFKKNAIEREQLEAAQETERAAKEERVRRVDQLAQDFETASSAVLSEVTAAAEQVKSSATAMSATADQTNQQSTAVAAASEEASSNVQTVASASEELASSISEISRQVEQSTKMATKAVAEAESANKTVQGLADAATSIGDVVDLINNIAAQTNLLALNATIEAARAGEAGKGFAVVASEVKSLASQTAKATEEISSQIASIQQESSGTVEAINGIRKVISEVNEIAGTIAAAVEEQGAATQEIARNVQQAAAGTQEVSSNITGVTQAAGETGQAAAQVLELSNGLTEQSKQLRGDVEKFLADLKSA